jgi:hypothetical protein
LLLSSRAPCSSLDHKKEKPPAKAGGFWTWARREIASASLRGLLFSVAAHHWAAPIETTVPPADPVMAAPAARSLTIETRKHDKATLLAVVQTFVERSRCVCEFFECGSLLAHHLRAHIESFDRITWAIGAGSRGKSFRTLLGEIAQRAFNRRPVLLLFGSKFQAGMKCGDSRLTERRDVFRARLPALHSLEIG